MFERAVSFFCYAGLCRPPVDKARRYLRSDDADAALPLGIAQTLHPPGSLVEGGETGAKVGRITTVCGRKADRERLQTELQNILKDLTHHFRI